MAETVDPKYLDKRTVERYLRNGELDEKTWKDVVESLPDVSEKSVPVETVMHDEDYEEEEEDEEEDEEEEDEEEQGGEETPTAIE
ncbi:MAG TPA: hypothetical protein VLQ93_08785 [Myxococcaceae bacterium]|nr:hypothetical protein [Myxococcaceae bacterium]